LTFEYSGIATRELKAAREIAQTAGVSEHRFVRLPDLREAGDIYRETFRSMPFTYIPMRNAIFYSLAASYAEEVGAEVMVGGHNRDDAKTFADAAPAFFDELESAFLVGSPILKKKRTKIFLPLSRKTKAQVVKLACSLGVPLRLTWSCHGEGESHCWECDGCLSRIAAFEKARVLDPLKSRQGGGKFDKQ